jgi:lysophospholipase L1-like esterase
VIEHINAGISDTATNFGNYRLAADLMNTNGHDMPDLVFVEFTSNDWIYNDMAGKQSLSDLERQAESLVHNIYSHNPYCDIVFVFTARGKNDSSRPAYVSVAEHYGIQYIDMGIPMQKLMTERGASQESAGKYYYTVDNLHPSSIGYGIYFDEICEVLTERLKDEPDSSPVKIDHAETSPEPMNDGLWTRPTVITASWLASSGKNIKKFTGCNNTMYGMSRDKMQSVAVTPDSYFINGTDAKINFEFTGTTFSVILYMNPNGVNMDYTIDGESKNFTIDKGAWVAFQCYNHTQLFVVEQNLPYGHHKVELTFNPTSGGKVNVRFGGIGVAGEVQK